MNSENNTAPNYLLRGVIISIVLMGLGILLGQYVLHSQRGGMPDELSATYLKEGRPVIGVQLIDQDNKPFDESRFRERWSFLFFGFTHCPDICPATLLIMKSVWNRLPAEAKQAPQPQMILVSVDPERDTPEILKQYVNFYHPEFIGVTGTHDKLDILTRQVGALYGYEDAEGGGYTVNHSAQIILVDPKGHMRAVFSTPHEVDAIVKTFSRIREYYGG